MEILEFLVIALHLVRSLTRPVVVVVRLALQAPQVVVVVVAVWAQALLAQRRVAQEADLALALVVQMALGYPQEEREAAVKETSEPG